jgi:hypothetical protein
VIVGIAAAAGVGSGSGDGSKEPNPGVSSIAGRPPTTAKRMQSCLAAVHVAADRRGDDVLRVSLPSGQSVDVRLAASGAAAARAGARRYVNNLVLSVPGTTLSQLDRHVLFNCAY